MVHKCDARWKLKLTVEILPSRFNPTARRLILVGETLNDVLPGSKRKLLDLLIDDKITHGISPQDSENFCHLFHVNLEAFFKYSESKPY